ncbi:MAG TPA: HemK/PrmC family methyltransferase [Candidatus Saccharimonadales bacterium]
MTVQEFLKEATRILREAEISSARLDCIILLEDALGLERAAILARPETEVTQPQLSKLNKEIAQRTKHVPLAYIRGEAPFYGRDFIVNAKVLVPRPETEIMIEMLKKLPLPASPSVADIGTGSGCIGITAALELPGAQAELYDIDAEALEVAAENVRTLKANAKIQESDLLEAKPTTDVILANLPYVPERYEINRAAGHEPKHAIFAGEDGLKLYRKFWGQVATLPQKPQFVLTESLPPQHNDLSLLAKHSGYTLVTIQNLIQVFRSASS